MHYRSLIAATLRLVRAGMSSEKAVALVSRTYAIDPAVLLEWLSNHREEI